MPNAVALVACLLAWLLVLLLLAALGPMADAVNRAVRWFFREEGL